VLSLESDWNRTLQQNPGETGHMPQRSTQSWIRVGEGFQFLVSLSNWRWLDDPFFKFVVQLRISRSIGFGAA